MKKLTIELAQEKEHGWITASALGYSASAADSTDAVSMLIRKLREEQEKLEEVGVERLNEPTQKLLRSLTEIIAPFLTNK